MKDEEESPQPLWRETLGDLEPWRRGRLVLVVFGAITLVSHLVILGRAVLWGNVETLLGQGAGALLFWLQFYFIWIGVHWVRWLQGLLSALWGFALIIWGVGGDSGVAIALGIYYFGFGSYLALAPSIYFFARRQQERRNWTEALVAAAIFLLVLASLSSGTYGFFSYKSQREADARHFADVGFERIFSDHDMYFFLNHASADLLKNYGEAELTRFLQDATLRAGTVHEFGPAAGHLQFWYGFPFKLASFGVMGTEGAGAFGEMQMELKVIDGGGGWQIDQISWFYLDPMSRRSPGQPD